MQTSYSNLRLEILNMQPTYARATISELRCRCQLYMGVLPLPEKQYGTRKKYLVSDPL